MRASRGVAALLPSIASAGSPLDTLRTGVSLLGAELGWRPSQDIGHDELRPRPSGSVRWSPPCSRPSTGCAAAQTRPPA